MRIRTLEVNVKLLDNSMSEISLSVPTKMVQAGGICKRPSMTILSDHDMSIKFHYELPFVRQIV